MTHYTPCLSRDYRYDFMYSGGCSARGFMEKMTTGWVLAKSVNHTTQVHGFTFTLPPLYDLIYFMEHQSPIIPMYTYYRHLRQKKMPN